MAICFALMLLAPGRILAHGHGEDTVRTESTSVSTNGHHEHHDELQNEEHEKAPYVLNAREQLLEHIHNKLVHFPIALLLVAFVFSLLALKWKNLDQSVLIMVLIAALFAVAAFFTGQAAHEEWERFDEHDPKMWIIHLHQKIGLGILITSWLWVLMLLVKPLKRFAWIIGLAASALVLANAFYGGVISHG